MIRGESSCSKGSEAKCFTVTQSYRGVKGFFLAAFVELLTVFSMSTMFSWVATWPLLWTRSLTHTHTHTDTHTHTHRHTYKRLNHILENLSQLQILSDTHSTKADMFIWWWLQIFLFRGEFLDWRAHQLCALCNVAVIQTVTHLVDAFLRAGVLGDKNLCNNKYRVINQTVRGGTATTTTGVKRKPFVFPCVCHCGVCVRHHTRPYLWSNLCYIALNWCISFNWMVDQPDLCVLHWNRLAPSSVKRKKKKIQS